MGTSAVIFDMDGLLIETEPVWRQAEIAIFGRLGLHVTEEQCMATMGVRVAQVVELWYSRAPWPGPNCEAVTREIEDEVIHHVLTQGAPMPGACEALQLVRQRGLPSAIASSSSMRLIDAVIQRLKIQEFIAIACSGDAEKEGKPDPAVYLTAARKLQVEPRTCIALEDSVNGVLSAQAAGMYCIGVPDPNFRDDPRMNAADRILPSLHSFTSQVLDEVQLQMSSTAWLS